MMMKRVYLKQFVFGLSLMISAASGLIAQTNGGSVAGTVVDPSGALIPEAQITISGENGFRRTLLSSNRGAFQLSNLAPGSYSISVDAVGFTPTLDGGVRVVTGHVTEEAIKLGISVNQVVEVTAEP